MDLRIKLPNELCLAVGHEMFPNRKVAVFVNGALMCPDQPGDEGDYNLAGLEIELHGADIKPEDLVTITDFGTFRWIHQNGHWHKL